MGNTPFQLAADGSHQEVVDTLRKWPATMAIAVLDDGLDVYYQLDAQSIIDLWQYTDKDKGIVV